MLATIAEVGDLDLLDQRIRHARCRDCTGATLGPGTVFVALCGDRAIHWSSWVDHPQEVYACAECVELIRARHCPCCDG